MNPAIAVIAHIKERFSNAEGVTYQSVLTALANVYRGQNRNPIDHAIRSILACEKDVHGVTESQCLEAVRIVFAPKFPIVYPDQFRPLQIIDPDGRVLWVQLPDPKPEPTPVSPSEGTTT